MKNKTKLLFIGFITLFLAACASNKSVDLNTSYKDGAQAYKNGNYALAMMHWLPLARNGNQHAQFGVANMYDKGLGMPQNHNKAYEWYIKAAKQGNINAQTNIGRLYAKGEGVERNFEMCYVWSNLAATKGLEVAVKNREECKRKLDTDELADAQELAEEYWNKYNKQ